MPAPTSSTRSRRPSGKSASSVATASPSIRFEAWAIGAFTYRSAALGSPLPNSRVSGSASPTTTSAKAPAHRRNSPISMVPWGYWPSIQSARAAGSLASTSGRGSSEPTLTVNPSPASSSTPALVIISSIRRNKRPCSEATPNCSLSSSGATVSPAVRTHPSRSRAKRAYDHASRSRSDRNPTRLSASTPSAARYWVKGSEPAAMALG